MIWGCVISIGGIVIQFITALSASLGAIGLFGPMFLLGIGNGLTLPNANACIVSVNPKLAGTASGLGSTIQITIGGIVAFITGYITSYNSSPYPLIVILLISISISLLFTLLAIKNSEQ